MIDISQPVKKEEMWMAGLAVLSDIGGVIVFGFMGVGGYLGYLMFWCCLLLLICGACFGMLLLYRKHEYGVEEPKKEWTCQYCGKDFVTYAEAETHERTCPSAGMGHGPPMQQGIGYGQPHPGAYQGHPQQGYPQQQYPQQGGYPQQQYPQQGGYPQQQY